MTRSEAAKKVARVRLREVREEDLPALFRHQADPESCRVAGVRARDEATFRALWDGIFKDSKVIARAIEADGELAGQISCYSMEGRDGVGYAIAREFWGRGIATRALSLFLNEVGLRPLHADVAVENGASIRVLERNGFVETRREYSAGTERYLAGMVASFVLE